MALVRYPYPAEDAVNVKDFGAVGDGITDDRHAFVSAIDAAGKGCGRVIIPKGKFLINTDGGSITIPEGISLVGAGGYQIRNLSFSLQGPLLMIVGTTNPAFIYDRGTHLEGFSVLYPDQPTNTMTPVEYPFFAVMGTNGSGKARLSNLYILNAYKGFLGNGGLAVDRVRGCFLKTFIRIEESSALSHVTDCAVSPLFNPTSGGPSTNTYQYLSENLNVFELEGGNDGLTVTGMSIFRANKYMLHSNDGSYAQATMNFARHTNVLLDAVVSVYVSTGGQILSLQFNNSFFNLFNPDNVTFSAPAVHIATAGLSGITGKTLAFSNCRFRNGSSEVIVIENHADALHLLQVTDCQFFDWNRDTSNVDPHQAAIRCELATCDLQITGNHFEVKIDSNRGLTTAVYALNFRNATVTNNTAVTVGNGFIFGNGTSLSFVGNNTSGTTTVGGDITGTVTRATWVGNNLDKLPTAPVASDRAIVMTPAEGVSSFGSPSLTHRLKHPLWAFDADSSESVSFSASLPSTWKTYDLVVRWINLGAGTGDVRWRVDTLEIGDGDTITDPASTPQILVPALAENTIEETTVRTGITVNAIKQTTFEVVRVAADVSDTLTNDVGLLGLILVKKS